MSPRVERTAVPDPEFHDKVVHRVFGPVVAYGQALHHPLWSLRHRQLTRQIRCAGTEILADQAGPYILGMKHKNGIDPLVASLVADTVGIRINMMAKKEIWETPVVGGFVGRVLERGGTFQIDRDAPLTEEDINHVGTIFANNGVLGMFPEAHRRDSDNVNRGNLSRGAALLAIKFGAPIVPVGISGTHETERGPIAVVIGAPMQVEHQPDLDMSNARAVVSAARPVLDELCDRMQFAQSMAVGLRTL